MTDTPPRSLRRLAPALLMLSVALPGDVRAQSTAPVWRGMVEASGNLLYGAASQRVFSASTGAGYDSPTMQFRFDVLTSYGDARDPEARVRRVIVRNSRASTSLDLTPHATFSPFTFGTAETSLQQRISSRYSAGAGGKYTFWRPDTVVGGFAEDLSLSAALLTEQTVALRTADRIDESRGAGTRNRWSVRGRYRRRLSNSLRIAHQSLYQPTVDRPGRYTLDVSTVLSVPLRTRTEFTLTHRERIDSEALDRGAPSTRDGQLLFGVRTTF